MPVLNSSGDEDYTEGFYTTVSRLENWFSTRRITSNDETVFLTRKDEERLISNPKLVLLENDFDRMKEFMAKAPKS